MTIRVLLADDHSVLRDGLEAMLHAHTGFEVVAHAQDGAEAVRKAVECTPDVAIIDIVMPQLDGIEATRQVRRRCAGCRVLILSMFSSGEHVFRALQAGAHGYLLKESAGAEVVEAVRSVHAGHRYLSQKITETVIDDYIREHHAASPLEALSRRERQILQGVAEGKGSSEIARALFLSPKTVDTYRSRMMHKLGLANVAGMVRFAIECGLTPP